MSLKIFFGPYEAHGVIKHKSQKLSGILAKLASLGYEVELIPTDRLNILVVQFRDKEIYRCDIRYLKFNIDFEDDPVAQILVGNIQETMGRFEAADNVPKFDVNREMVRGDAKDHLSECEGSVERQSKNSDSVSTADTEGSVRIFIPKRKRSMDVAERDDSDNRRYS